MNTPADIVSLARPVTSSLHPFFLWDDQEAARLYQKAIDEQKNALEFHNIIIHWPKRRNE
jgi:hypothetical protein